MGEWYAISVPIVDVPMVSRSTIPFPAEQIDEASIVLQSVIRGSKQTCTRERRFAK